MYDLANTHPILAALFAGIILIFSSIWANQEIKNFDWRFGSYGKIMAIVAIAAWGASALILVASISTGFFSKDSTFGFFTVVLLAIGYHFLSYVFFVVGLLFYSAGLVFKNL